MSTYFSYTVPDPFINTTNVVNPLQLDGVNPDEYSIKLTVFNPSTKQNQIYVFTGQLIEDLLTQSLGIQAVIMESIQLIIQQVFNPSYNIGALPKLGRPAEYTFNPDDILVSFSDNDDYFVFNGTGTAKEITFITTGQAPQVYMPGTLGTINTTFASLGSPGPVDIYDVTYDEYGVFTIVVNGTTTMIFDTVATFPTTIATYDGVALTEATLGGGEIAYTGDYYTRVGITILPTVLPVDQNDLEVAEGVDGLFYTEGAVPDSQPLIDYIIAQDTFTTSQTKFVNCLVKTIFNCVHRSVKRVLGLDNRDAYSTNNGFACAMSMKYVAFEIKLS